MKQRISVFVFSLLFLMLSIGATSFAQAPQDLDRYVKDVLRAFEVPGAAVTIVKDGKVVVAKGYGVKKLGEGTPVDPQTLFGIASNTKAFTATALGILVEEGKLEWDAPVIRYLPWFRLSDPYVTKEMTIRDLLVHRSGLGLGAGDLLWWPPSTYNRHQIARRLQYIPLATSFRSAYAYDNVLYLIAGEVIEEISGMTWEDFIQSRILDKVGMRQSNPRHSDAEAGGNVAAPHGRIEGTVRPVKPFASDNTNPAGGINSCAEDMAKWLIVQLDSGRVADGSRLFSPRTTRQLWTLVTPMPFGTPPPELAPLRNDFRGYALGFEVRDYRGKKLVTHTGGLPGYLSQVAMIPELKLGVAVLTNQESGAAFNSITYWILDHYLGVEQFDWKSAYKTLVDRFMARLEEREQQTSAGRDTESRPSLPLEKYAGTYADAWYGNVVIEHADGKLVIRFAKTPALVGDLEHWQYDTFLARWHDRELRADAFVTFSLNPDGSIANVLMKPASPAVDFSFDFQDLNLKPAESDH